MNISALQPGVGVVVKVAWVLVGVLVVVDVGDRVAVEVRVLELVGVRVNVRVGELAAAETARAPTPAADACRDPQTVSDVECAAICGWVF